MQYKFKLVQELKPIDHPMCGLAIDLQKMPILVKIIFSDEAHFDIDGYVNKQNCRIWATRIH